MDFLNMIESLVPSYVDLYIKDDNHYLFYKKEIVTLNGSNMIYFLLNKVYCFCGLADSIFSYKHFFAQFENLLTLYM